MTQEVDVKILHRAADTLPRAARALIPVDADNKVDLYDVRAVLYAMANRWQQGEALDLRGWEHGEWVGGRADQEQP